MPIRPRTPLKPRTGMLRHWTLWAWFALAVLLSVGGVGLWRSGRWLVREDAFAHVKWAVVLAGETRDCERTDAALRLFQAGRIDTLVLSACRIFKNRYQSEFMVDYVAEQGMPRDRIFEFRQDAYSTQEEARLLVRQFRLQNLDTVLIITSNFHTARTRRIFRKLAQGHPVVLVAAADYPLYDPNAWWSNRESRKLWFDEWAKTFFTTYELARARPEAGKAEYQGLTPDPFIRGATASPASLDTATRTLGDSADTAASRYPDGGKEPSEPGLDSLRAPGPAPEAADSVHTRMDSAGAAEGALSETQRAPAAPKDSAAAVTTRGESVPAGAKSGEAAKARAEARDAKAAKEAEAKKAASHASRKPVPQPPKAIPKREEKKAEKPRKQG